MDRQFVRCAGRVMSRIGALGSAQAAARAGPWLVPSVTGNCLSLRTGELPGKVALCACFPPKLHAPPGSGLPGLLCDCLETTRCPVDAEGHSNATIRLSEDAAPLSGSLN